jgi:hypothetical protein
MQFGGAELQGTYTESFYENEIFCDQRFQVGLVSSLGGVATRDFPPRLGVASSACWYIDANAHSAEAAGTRALDPGRHLVPGRGRRPATRRPNSPDVLALLFLKGKTHGDELAPAADSCHSQSLVTASVCGSVISSSEPLRLALQTGLCEPVAHTISLPRPLTGRALDPRETNERL